MFIHIFLSLSMIWKMIEDMQLAGNGSVPVFKQQRVLAKEMTSSWDNCGLTQPQITMFSPFNI